ncbi:hypothetical protein MIR68_007048 [Amoeboaphelidium protococcarum]|nr:hypothetical protein MIR68_007048 [Amoeboaphelidium protococcarum]
MQIDSDAILRKVLKAQSTMLKQQHRRTDNNDNDNNEAGLQGRREIAEPVKNVVDVQRGVDGGISLVGGSMNKDGRKSIEQVNEKNLHNSHERMMKSVVVDDDADLGDVDKREIDSSRHLSTRNLDNGNSSSASKHHFDIQSQDQGRAASKNVSLEGREKSRPLDDRAAYAQMMRDSGHSQYGARYDYDYYNQYRQPAYGHPSSYGQDYYQRRDYHRRHGYPQQDYASSYYQQHYYEQPYGGRYGDERQHSRSQSRSASRHNSRDYGDEARYDPYPRPPVGSGRGGEYGPSAHGDRRVNSSNRHKSSERSKPKSLQQELEKLTRTVGIHNLNKRVGAEDLIDFFAKHHIGHIVDAQIVRDSRTGASKGIGYVEFQSVDSVGKAVDLAGREIMGNRCIIRRTDNERSLLMKQICENPDAQILPGLSLNADIKSVDDLSLTTGAVDTSQRDSNGKDEQKSLKVEHLHEALSEQDVEAIFGEFGPVEKIQLQELKTAGGGVASGGNSSTRVFIVTFQKGDDAKMAMEGLNGFELAGQKLKVTWQNRVSASVKRKGSSVNASDSNKRRFVSISADKDGLGQNESDIEDEEDQVLSRQEIMKRLVVAREHGN